MVSKTRAVHFITLNLSFVGEPIASNWNAQFDSRAEGAYGPYATAQKYIHLKNPSIGAHTANCYSEATHSPNCTIMW